MANVPRLDHGRNMNRKSVGLSPLDRVLERLKSVRRSGKEWTARCPTHKDDRNSLSVSTGTDGRVLLCCHAGCVTDGILTAIGLTMADLFPTSAANGEKPNAKIEAIYPYQDADGALLYEVVRFAGKRFRQRRPNGADGWIWNLRYVRRVLYRLRDLIAAPSDRVVFVVEGEKDADRLAQLELTATTNPLGAGKWRTDYAELLRGRRVVILPDNDEAGKRHSLQVAAALAGVASSIKIVDLPGVPAKGDVSDWLNDGRTVNDLAQLVEQAPSWVPTVPQCNTKPTEGASGRPSQASVIVGLAGAAELFHSPDGEPFATILVGDHHETLALRAREFKLWLRRRYYMETDSAPNAQAAQDALGVLEARALFDGVEHVVAVRVGEANGAVYVDLANQRWDAIEITPTGWRVITNPPVKFRRTRGMLAFPMPLSGGTVGDLRPFLNVASDEDFILITSCLIAALRPRGPYPVLILAGEQGSAKSSTQRVLRALTDPNTAPLRAEPRDVRDLMIAARNGWIAAFDNISHLDPWLSDALCRMATGGGFSTRELYTDTDEILFDAMRPVMLNGIDNPAIRGDLLERAVVLTAPSILEAQRRAEAEFWTTFEQARPRILGALFSAVAAGLHNLPSVALPTRPRMADFAEWAVATAPALGWSPIAFLNAYTGNRDDANQVALDASSLAPLIVAIADGAWTGTASDLLKMLNGKADDATRRQKSWPGSPKSLSGALRRLAPNFRNAGIDIVFGKTSGSGSKKTITIRKVTPSSDACDATDATATSDTQAASQSASQDGSAETQGVAPNGQSDAGVAGVATMPLFSGPTPADDGPEVSEWSR